MLNRVVNVIDAAERADNTIFLEWALLVRCEPM